MLTQNAIIQARSYVQARGGSFLLVPRRLNFFETSGVGSNLQVGGGGNRKFFDVPPHFSLVPPT